jgi:ATP-dependent Clp protease ATP-binding subunit ClpC
MFERFSNKARSVLVFAQDEARELGHNFIGTEHLLLGVISASDDVVVQALHGYDFTLEDVRDRIRELIGPGTDEEITGPPPFTPRAKKVLELSLREALSMGHDHIGVPHILLGILREGEGVGAKVLEDLGVTHDRTRLWVGQVMGEGEPIRGRGRRARRWRDLPPGPRQMTGSAGALGLRAAVLAEDEPVGSHHYLLALFDDLGSLAAKVLASLGVTKQQVEGKIEEIGVEGTSDAPPKAPSRPKSVKLAEGVEVRISDPELNKLVESGQVEELVKEIVRRSKPA